MCSRFPDGRRAGRREGGRWLVAALGIGTLVAAGLSALPPARSPALRVCADPNNLPFSNQHREGFENRVAELLARELGARLEYTWWAQRRGFLHNTLQAGLC